MLEAFDRSRKVVELLRSYKTPKGLVHGDAKALNVLNLGHEIKLIDWDFSYYGDTWRELAELINWYCMDEEQEEYFITSYLDRSPTDEERSILYIMKVLDRAIGAFGWLKWMGDFDFDGEGWQQAYDQNDASFLQEVGRIHAEGKLVITEDLQKRMVLSYLKQFMLDSESELFAQHYDFLSGVAR